MKDKLMLLLIECKSNAAKSNALRIATDEKENQERYHYNDGQYDAYNYVSDEIESLIKSLIKE